MRLIDADRLKRQVEGRLWKARDKFVELIDNAPAIEAEPTEEQIQKYILDHNLTHKIFEPVKRGKWIKVSDRNYKCSVCGDWWSGEKEEIKTLLYCPNCGSTMERSEE